MSLQVKEDKNNRATQFYCEVCDCSLRDSLSYLDHVRGKRHNRNIGISLKNFTDSTLEEVKEMLDLKKSQRNKDTTSSDTQPGKNEIDIEPDQDQLYQESDDEEAGGRYD